MTRTLAGIDEELVGNHDIVLLFHVEEIPKTLLSEPGDFFKEPEVDEPPALPENGMAVDDGAGLGDDPLEVAGERGLRGEGEDDEPGGTMDDVDLSFQTPLKDLRRLCEQLDLPKSGSKGKVLKRLRDYRDLSERQLATSVAKKLYQERDRDPTTLPTPVLPSAMQQELHAITHQPFAAWCPARVMGRSRQSRHGEGRSAAEEGAVPGAAK